MLGVSVTVLVRLLGVSVTVVERVRRLDRGDGWPSIKKPRQFVIDLQWSVLASDFQSIDLGNPCRNAQISR